jgi:hypothetical protein
VEFSGIDARMHQRPTPQDAPVSCFSIS